MSVDQPYSEAKEKRVVERRLSSELKLNCVFEYMEKAHDKLPIEEARE